MRIVVAGATGAVGRALIPLLAGAGHDVTALTRDPAKADVLRASGAAAEICDVFDAGRLAAVVAAARPDAVIHQLTDLPAVMNPSELAEIYQKNNRVRAEGTRNLVDAASAAGVRRFIVQSMGTWYRPEGGPVKTENDPLWTDAPEPIGTAVRVLAEMEALVTARMPIGVVLRYGAFYGPGTWYAADGEIARRMRSRGFPIVGGGDGITSFIHVDDAASAAVAALAAAASAIYNVADDEPAAASTWMPDYAQAIGAPSPMTVPALVARMIVGKPMTEWMTTMRGASNARIKSDLGWRPAHASWRQGFRA